VQRDATVRATELIISSVLRGGVLLSAAIIAVGVIAFYARYGTAVARTLADRVFPHTPGDVLAGVVHGDPLAIITLGLLLLLVTPVMRVLVSIVAFAIERDWRYVAITTLVLVILLVSFVIGRAAA
jgi:uncharacterized membrane protein